ncbi:MAG TPA: glycine oxidase ThiO [Gemmatimonadales bacterium]|nr:glycine oxidase ThiO [Gemmatimonadales bacterium]
MVVGGGAIGAACARELARAGWRVIVLDPDGERGQAWRAAAGMLAPQIEAGEGHALLELGLAARERYGPLADELRASTGIDVGLRREGIANLAMDEADVARLRAKVAWQRQQGLVCDWLEPGEVRGRWPALGTCLGALWAPHEGAIDPVRLVEALRADAAAAGARLTCDEAVRLERRGDRVVGIVGRHSRYPAGAVVLAAGAWTGGVVGAARPACVAPGRGQMAALQWPPELTPGIFYGKDCYVLARDGEAICGSTLEYAGFDPSVTSEGLSRILAAAGTLCPPLAGLDVRRTWAGLRPMTPDGLPLLGAEPRVEGLWYATGHGRNGILLAGITALMLRLLMCGQTPTEDLSALRPDRFWSA